MANLSPTEGRRRPLLLLLGTLGVALAYCWVAPAVLYPYRGTSWSWSAFRAIHTMLFLCLAGAAIWRGSLHQRLVWFLIVAAVWTYAFFFIWLNVWGS
jgi:hypothetical protein